MRRPITYVAGGALFSAVLAAYPVGSAHAQEDDTPGTLNRRVQAQEDEIHKLRKDIETLNRKSEKAHEQARTLDTRLSRLAGNTEILESLEISGLMEVEATHSRDFNAVDQSDLTLATVELGIDAAPAEFIETHLLLLYEEEGGDTVTLDEGTITLKPSEEVHLRVGKMAVPFGRFETAMSSDPLTLEMAEAKEVAALAAFERGGFSLEGYVFNGDTRKKSSDDHIDQFGISAIYGTALDAVDLAFGGGYISTLSDSDLITDTLGVAATTLSDTVPAWNGNARLQFGDISFFGEYIGALETYGAGEIAFRGQGAQPAVWSGEAAWETHAFSRQWTLAATVQGTKEAVALGLPEVRYGGAVTLALAENAALTAEFLHDADYEPVDGGTGEDGDTATLKLAVEF